MGLFQSWRLSVTQHHNIVKLVLGLVCRELRLMFKVRVLPDADAPDTTELGALTWTLLQALSSGDNDELIFSLGCLMIRSLGLNGIGHGRLRCNMRPKLQAPLRRRRHRRRHMAGA